MVLNTVVRFSMSYLATEINNCTCDLVTRYSFTYMDRWQSSRLQMLIEFYHWIDFCLFMMFINFAFVLFPGLSEAHCDNQQH